MTYKRKKSAQGVPVQPFSEHSQLLSFVAQAVCLKKDGNYLGEHAFMDASRIFNGGTCDWATILEKSLSNQTRSLKEGKQKLYTCAPIWQRIVYHDKEGLADQDTSHRGGRTL